MWIYLWYRNLYSENIFSPLLHFSVLDYLYTQQNAMKMSEMKWKWLNDIFSIENPTIIIANNEKTMSFSSVNALHCLSKAAEEWEECHHLKKKKKREDESWTWEFFTFQWVVDIVRRWDDPNCFPSDIHSRCYASHLLLLDAAEIDATS